MSREAFMQELTALLCDISPQEREEALDYYERYFDEAGSDLQQAIERLGTPQKVAQDIKSGLRGEYFYTENGTENAYAEQDRKTPASCTIDIDDEKRSDRAEDGWSMDDGMDGMAQKAKSGFWSWWQKQTSVMRVVWFALALAVFFPAVGAVLGTATGLVGGVLSIVLGAIGLLFCIFAGALCITIASYAAGVACMIYGVIMLFAEPFRGLLSLGIGCLGVAAGILMTFACWWLYFKALPALARAVRNAFRRIFPGRRKAA